MPLEAFSASATGALTGAVVHENGVPIPGAAVVYNSVVTVIQPTFGQKAVSGPILSSSVKTAADGSFSVTGLPPATYSLCAYGIQVNHLGSCEWGQGPVRVAVTAGQTASPLRFVVAEGTLLTFQVADRGHQVVDLESLSTVNGRIPISGANFAVGIWASAGCAAGAEKDLISCPWGHDPRDR